MRTHYWIVVSRKTGWPAMQGVWPYKWQAEQARKSLPRNKHLAKVAKVVQEKL